MSIANAKMRISNIQILIIDTGGGCFEMHSLFSASFMRALVPDESCWESYLYLCVSLSLLVFSQALEVLSNNNHNAPRALKAMQVNNSQHGMSLRPAAGSIAFFCYGKVIRTSLFYYGKIIRTSLFYYGKIIRTSYFIVCLGIFL